MNFRKAIEGIKCISCGEYYFAILNSSKRFDEQFSDKQNSFFANLDDILVQNRVDTPTRWAFHCFLSRSGILKENKENDASNFQIDSAIYEFEKISKKDRLLKNLKLFLFGNNIEIPNIKTDKLALEISKEILYVATHHSSLYRTLQLLFKPLIAEITDFRLFKLLGYSAFSLYPSAPPKEFWTIRLLTTNEQYRDVIYFSQDLSFLRSLQNDYIEHFQYPNDFPGSLIFNSSACSFSITSVYKNLHFVDLLAQLIKEKIHKLEISSIPGIARVSPSFIPILFAAYQPFLYLSPQIFIRLISAKLPSINNPENKFCYKNNNFSEKIIELQQRFINDLVLAKYIVDLNNEIVSSEKQTAKKSEKNSFFGRKKRTESFDNDKQKSNSNNESPKVRRNSEMGAFIRDFNCPISEIFKNHSIPFLCNGYFRRKDFLQFENKSFFIFNDEEVKTDFDFIHTYLAISDTITLLETTQIKNQNMIPTQRALLTTIEQNLCLIRDQNLLKRVAIDIFSLLFIKASKNENSGFLVQNICIAYMLVEILKKFFNKDRFIMFGEILLSQPSFLHSKTRLYGISDMLTPNLNFLLDIIVKRDWNGANKIVRLLCGNQRNSLDPRSKVYWRTYILSSSVYKLISGKSCNIECEMFKEDLNLEISLSSSIYNTDDCIIYVQSVLEKQPPSEEKDKYLQLVDDISKIRESRKKIEFEDIFSPLCDSYWIDVEPAVVNFEMFPFDFFRERLFDRYEKVLQKSKSLFKFVNFANLYFNCVHSNNANGGNFALNPKQAISEAFNNGQIDLAEQMASVMNINLFDFAMHNQKSFKFSPESVQHFSSKYPLECAEILYFMNKSNQVKMSNFIKTDEKMEKMLNYLSSEDQTGSKSTLEDTVEIEFIELIKSTKSDENLYKEFDDYLYKINHSRVSQIVISNFENINKDVAFYLLNIFGYTIDMNSLSDDIKNLLFQKETEKIVSKEITDNYQIVERLIESDKFKLASKYIMTKIQTQKEKDEIIVKIIRKLISSNEKDKNMQIYKFISEFQNQKYLYELIASEIQESIPVILDICPISIRSILHSFSILPDSIKTVSSLVDKSTIANAICNQIRDKNDFDFVFLLTKEHASLFTENDDNLRLILNELSESCTSIEKYMKCSMHLFTQIGKITNNEMIFQSVNSSRICKDLEKIKIDSIESEFEAFLHLRKITRFNRICPLDDKLSSILNTFELLLLESPFFSTHTSYTLESKSLENRQILFDIFVKLDVDQLAFSMPVDLFDRFTYIKHKVEIMLKLGRFDAALHLLNVNKQYVYEMDELFLSPFFYKNFFNSDLLLLLSNQWSNQERFVSQIMTESELSSSLSSLLNYKVFASSCFTKSSSNHFLSFCSDFCERFSTKDSFFRFCIRRGAMNTVVSKFMALEDNESFDIESTSSCQQLFINSIVECSIEYDKLQLLKKEISDFSKSGKSMMSGYWSALLDFCEKRCMGFLLLDVSEILARKDKAAVAYIDMFAEVSSTNLSKKAEVIEKIKSALLEIIGDKSSQPTPKTDKDTSRTPKIRRIRSTSFNTKQDESTSSANTSTNANINISKCRSTTSININNKGSGGSGGGGGGVAVINDGGGFSDECSSILFDPEEFNSRSPDEICEYDMIGASEEDERSAARASKLKARSRYSHGELLLIANLLSEVIGFFAANNFLFDESMNLFNGSLACIELGGFLLRRGEFGLLKKVSETMRVPVKAIINSFFESITKYRVDCTDIVNSGLNTISTENLKGIENSNSAEILIAIDKSESKVVENSNDLNGVEKTDSIENGNSESIENLNENTSTDFNEEEKEIMQFIEDTKNKEAFWKVHNFFYVRLYLSKLSFSRNFRLIPIILDMLVPQENKPALLFEFDFLMQAFDTIKQNNVEVELIPAIASRASFLGDYEMVKKCENELGIEESMPAENESQD